MQAKKVVNHAQIGPVEYSKRKGQRSIRISLKPGLTKVSMPYYTPQRIAEKFLETKIDWVKQNMRSGQEFCSGMHIGKSYVLNITGTSPNRSKIKDNMVEVSGSDEHIKKTVIRALKKESETLIAKRLDFLANKIGLDYKNVKFKYMTSRWGSCSNTKELTFSVLLVQLKWHLIDYVIVHELCHTKQMNHSVDFWKLVELYYPNYKKVRKELRAHTPVIYNTAYGNQKS